MLELDGNLTSDELAACLRQDYATFCAFMQDDGYFDPVHEDCCERIQQELERTGNLQALRENDDSLSKEVARIAVVWPRGALKSTIITKYLPVWLALQNATVRNLIVSNTAPNAGKKLDNIRSLFDTHQQFRGLYQDLLPDPNNKWTSSAACINREGSYQEQTFEAAGVQTQVTGRHYNAIFEDDTVAPKKDSLKVESALPSMEDVEKGIGWHRMATPLMVPKGCRIRLVVTTRWTDYDIIAYVKANENYLIIDVPAMDVLGKPNFSIFYSADELEAIRKNVGTYMFSALYLNNPIPAGDRLFRMEWLQNKFNRKSVPPGARYVISVDPAIGKRDDACETAIVAAWHFSSMIWIDEIIHGHFSPAETVVRTLNLIATVLGKHSVAIVVETVNYQKALSYFLHDEIRRRNAEPGALFGLWSVPIYEVNPRMAKEARIAALQPLYENGQVYHREGLDSTLESQLVQFPHGRLCDVVDALAHHLEVYQGVYIEEPKKEVENEEGTFWLALQEVYGRTRSAGRGLRTPSAERAVESLSGYVVGIN